MFGIKVKRFKMVIIMALIGIEIKRKRKEFLGKGKEAAEILCSWIEFLVHLLGKM